MDDHASPEQVSADLADLDLEGHLLCHATVLLATDAPIIIGQTPWQWRRISNIVGGRFSGSRLSGIIINSGADWALQGQLPDGTQVSHLDVRSVWQTDDGAMIFVTYNGRVSVSPDIWDRYRDLSTVNDLSPKQYYFRIVPLFQTEDQRYAWLNSIVAVGLGRRTRTGVQYKIFEIN